MTSDTFACCTYTVVSLCIGIPRDDNHTATVETLSGLAIAGLCTCGGSPSLVTAVNRPATFPQQHITGHHVFIVVTKLKRH